MSGKRVPASIFLYLLAAVLAACSVAPSLTTSLEPVALAGQQTYYHQGVGMVTSAMPGSLVGVLPGAPSFTDSQRPEVTLIIFNGSDVAFDVSLPDVTVSINGSPVRLLTADELVNEAKSEQNRNRWIAVLAAGVSGPRREDGTIEHEGTTAVGGVRGTYSGTTYDPEAARRADAERAAKNHQMWSQISARFEQKMSDINATALQRTTLIPKAWYMGKVTLSDLPQPQLGSVEMSLLVNAGQDGHEFKFRLSRASVR